MRYYIKNSDSCTERKLRAAALQRAGGSVAARENNKRVRFFVMNLV